MKHYNDMMPAEQAKWIEDFSRLTNPIPTDPSEIQQLFQLLSVWPFAERFCSEGLQYGDYMARTYRLPVYIDKVKDTLADGLVQTDANGKPIAVVAPGAPLRRRGRPTREEAAARLRGEVQVVQEDTPETRRRRAVAKLLGLKVVNGEPQREKNNAELAAERAAKKAAEEKIHPDLFAKPDAAAADDRGQVPGSNKLAGTEPARDPSPVINSAPKPKRQRRKKVAEPKPQQLSLFDQELQAEQEDEPASRKLLRGAGYLAAASVAIILVYQTGLIIPLGLIGLATSGLLK